MTRAEPKASWTASVDVAPASAIAPAAADDLLEQILAARGRFSLELCRRLQEIYKTYAMAAGKRTLEDCHGWKPEPSDRTRVRRLAEAVRQSAMVDAYQALTGCEGLSSWKRCEALARAAVEFECDYWPRWRETGPPADGTSRVLDALYRAFIALPDDPPAKSVAGIRRLLTRAGVADVS